MCGIAGLTTEGETPLRERVAAMCDVIRHRGPDGEGIHVGPGVGLGMRRLAIIDLVTGDQPVSNTAGTIQAVFNGEIYNYRELRRDLQARGHVFRSQGDSEVIPHLYEEYGLDCLERLNGMFAIALWDSRRKLLLLARDRAGIKPLHYSLHGGNLYFGSEVKSILAAGGSTRTIDGEGIDQLLTFEYTAGPTTLFSDVKKLGAGEWLLWQSGNVTRGRFWNPMYAPVSADANEQEIAEQLRATIIRAVRRQMVSDVPLGAFLSGGIDSSILVAAMTEAGSSPPQTFSVGFGDASYDELRYARLVAERFKTEHHEEVLTPHYLAVLPEVIAQLDQPIADFSVFPTLLVARMARRRVTVALSGDGGDELFGGYDAYAADAYAHVSLDRLPAALTRLAGSAASRLPLGEGKRGIGNMLRRFLEGATMPRAWQHVRWMAFLSERQRESLYMPDFHSATHGRLDGLVERMLNGSHLTRLERQMLCDLRFYLPEDILPKVDLMTMAVSLEARVPYLDNEVIDLALTIPGHMKVRGGKRKHILKLAFANDLPPAIVQRGKEGFSMPLKNWLNEDWNELMHDLLAADPLRRDGLFRPEAVAKLISEHESRRHNHSHILWALMVFHLWKSNVGARVS